MLQRALKQATQKMPVQKQLDIEYIVKLLDIRFHNPGAGKDECEKIIRQLEIINTNYNIKIDIYQYKSDLLAGQ